MGIVNIFYYTYCDLSSCFLHFLLIKMMEIKNISMIITIKVIVPIAPKAAYSELPLSVVDTGGVTKMCLINNFKIGVTYNVTKSLLVYL